MSWRQHAQAVESLGLSADKAVSLADLHRRRRETSAQYFTPQWVARGIWQSFSEVIDQARTLGVSHFSVMDNSIGSGRLLEGAPVDDMRLFGLDIDGRCIDALTQDAAAADLMYEFIQGELENLRVRGMHFAVINPPFSIHLESPNLEPLGCNSFGRFGQASSALSHEYALEQALDAAVFTAAVLPVSMDAYCRSKRSLLQVVHLPRHTFRGEGANVETAVYFFGPDPVPSVTAVSVTDGDAWPLLTQSATLLKYRESPRFRLVGVDHSAPIITLPVTGNRRVELHHHNRRITLKYHCGLVQARVANGLLQDVAGGKRLPSNIRFIGDGQLLLDVLLLQDDPESQLDRLAHRIRQLGGEPWVSPTLAGYYRKLIRKHMRASTPMYRMVKTKGVESVTVVAKRRTLLNPLDFNSPSVGKGQSLFAIPKEGEYTLELDGHQVVLRRDELLKRFDIQGESDVDAEGAWTLKYPGLNHHFPHLAHQHRQGLKAAGIDWLDQFQEDSLTEGLISPVGYIGGWEQGSGKARYALALALLHSGHNMIALESGLLPEMVLEIQKLGLSDNLWKIVAPGDVPSAKINLVSYATLRQGNRIAYTKTVKRRGEATEVLTVKVVRTQAERWRRHISTLICDEGGLLANINTQQSRAIRNLAARKLIILDGTPQRNYPRDLLPLSVASAGNGCAHQPFGVKGKAFIDPRLLKSGSYASRGEDVFYERHVVTQWVTNEFREELQSSGGGKREVPKIDNLPLFRSWLAPNIQRRLRSEPDLAAFNNCPPPVRKFHTVSWDEKHLRLYLEVATDFASWYKQDNGRDGKSLNLVTVLARIGAVQRAANSPHIQRKTIRGTYTLLTSKQRKALELIEQRVAEGRKVILYAESPDVLDRLHRELEDRDIGSVLFTGKQAINKRARALNDEFRFGPKPVLLSSWVGQRGLNLPQASAVIFYERSWSATIEEQAIYRTQRPEQTETVLVDYLHLAGSIDTYAAQLVEWKSKAADSGLDYGDQVGEDEEFLHLDTLLHQFCDQVLNMSIHEAKAILAA